MSKSNGVAVAEPVVLDDETKREFLEQLAANPQRGHVALMRELGVKGTRGQIREAIEKQLAGEIAETRADVIRDEVMRRALEGYEEPVFYRGDIVGYKRVMNPRDTELAAKMWVPEARDHLEVTGAGGGPIEIEGRAVVGLGDVLALARELGIGAPVGVDAGAARRALPAAEDVLPDPPAR